MNPKRIVYSEGEDERVLRAVQVIVDEKLAEPIIIGREEVVLHRIDKLALRIKKDRDFILVDPQDDPRYKAYCQTYQQLMERQGVSPDHARVVVRTNTTVIAALMVYRQEADAMLAGPVGRFITHAESIAPILGMQPGVNVLASLAVLVTGKGTFFFCDPYVNENPTARELAEITVLAAEQVRHFGIEPKVALLSHANFGSRKTESAVRMQEALTLINQLAPELEAEGEMHGDTALIPAIREKLFPNSKLTGCANLLVMPNLDAANISFNLAKSIGEGQSIGPILLGLERPGHILTPSATVRGIVNMTALAVTEAQTKESYEGLYERAKVINA